MKIDDILEYARSTYPQYKWSGGRAFEPNQFGQTITIYVHKGNNYAYNWFHDEEIVRTDEAYKKYIEVEIKDLVYTLEEYLHEGSLPK